MKTLVLHSPEKNGAKNLKMADTFDSVELMRQFDNEDLKEIQESKDGKKEVLYGSPQPKGFITRKSSLADGSDAPWAQAFQRMASKRLIDNSVSLNNT